MAVSPDSSPELNPLSLGDLKYQYGDNDSDRGSRNGDRDVDAIAPLPEYKAAGETIVDFDGLLKPAPDLRLREDLSEGCGGQTWPAGLVLGKHMLRYRRAEMANARILELGAGGGLTGLGVALANQAASDAKGECPPAEPRMYITDQEMMLSLMKHNIVLNGLEREAKALVLNWGEPLPEEVRTLRPNIILAADCVYFEPAFPLLLTTLEDLLSIDDEATPQEDQMVIYFCFKKRRRADNQFLKKAQKKFCLTEVFDEERPVFSRENLFLYTITRKPAKTANGNANGSTNGNGTKRVVKTNSNETRQQQ
ncbi:nicotinamide n-methyltransferase [Ophiostoma piceae UAMH 11346]|uniref:Protein-lysine N-methyltransferase EFM6 n=1 Tax=Ophiostoma piceae (strain UAMH 11346) TaxID=1262450 RepID=S3D8R6_OPHP1|nr:nicotinamide n-methyltransferase [Ophiostoma piceae UAMH 11346]